MTVLRLTVQPVKILGECARRVMPQEAIRLARSGDYEWGGSNHRVRWMRPIGVPAWKPCYRTAEAPVLQPSIEWLRSRRGLA